MRVDCSWLPAPAAGSWDCGTCGSAAAAGEGPHVWSSHQGHQVSQWRVSVAKGHSAEPASSYGVFEPAAPINMRRLMRCCLMLPADCCQCGLICALVLLCAGRHGRWAAGPTVVCQAGHLDRPAHRQGDCFQHQHMDDIAVCCCEYRGVQCCHLQQMAEEPQQAGHTAAGLLGQSPDLTCGCEARLKPDTTCFPGGCTALWQVVFQLAVLLCICPRRYGMRPPPTTYASIEPADGADINDLCLWPGSGLLLLATDAPCGQLLHPFPGPRPQVVQLPGKASPR